MDIHSKRVLITGINGFTGRPLRAALEDHGANVFGITNNLQDEKSDQVLEVDLEDAELLNKTFDQVRPDYVIHLAGLSFANHKNPLPYYQTNVIGSENLLKACLQKGQQIEALVLASSAAVYGAPTSEYVSESEPVSPISHYGLSKLAMEFIAQTYSDELPIIITRPFNYVGAEQAARFLIPKIANHFNRKCLEIELGNTNVIREFSDIRDVVQIYIRLLEGDGRGIVNICSGRAHSLDEVLATFTEISGHEVKVKVNPNFVRKNDIKSLVGDSAKLQEMTNYKFQYTLKATLSSMLK